MYVKSHNCPCIEQKKKFHNTTFNDTLIIFSDNIKIRDGSKKYVPFNNNKNFGLHVQKMISNYQEAKEE